MNFTHKILHKHHITGHIVYRDYHKYTKIDIQQVISEYINLYGYAPEIEVGDYTYGLPTIKWWGHRTKLCIGKFSLIAKGVTFFLGGGVDHQNVSMYPFWVYPIEWPGIEKVNEIFYNPSKGDIIVGNDVWIGANASILSSCTIGDGAVIGAHSLVTKDVPPYTIVGGNPAKIIRKRFSDEIIEKLLEIEWWNWDKEKIDQAIPILISHDISGIFDFHENYPKLPPQKNNLT